jgi:hypothetical protein
MPLLEGARDHLLALCPDVVLLWLCRLKETHPDQGGWYISVITLGFFAK